MIIYLVYSATTPVNEEVLESFTTVTQKFIGNPNSLHKLGLEANKIITEATKQIANILNIKPEEIIYTSGASEANNTAIKGICLKNNNKLAIKLLLIAAIFTIVLIWFPWIIVYPFTIN